MEYVQQVSVQIAAASLGEAKKLTDELERHRSSLRSQRGFRGMQVTRSEEPDGSAALTIETRWRDAEALTAYTELPENAFGIVSRHSAIAVPGTTAVRRMEAVDTGNTSDSTAYERLAWAFFMPVAAVTFGLAIIFALSRVYLASSSEVAAITAALVAIVILLVAWYFAANVVPRWQYAAVGMTAAAVLIGGGIWGQVNYEPGHSEAVTESPEPVDGTPVAPGQVVIETRDNFFTVAGSDEENPTITIAAGPLTIPVENVGRAIHNVHIATSGGFDVAFCKPGEGAPCSDPASIRGGASGEIVVDLPAGSYTYRCDFHTADMEGTITVQ